MDQADLLLGDAGKHRVRAFVRSLGRGDTVVADPDLIGGLVALRPPSAEWSIATLGETLDPGPAPTGDRRLIVWSLGDETLQLDRLAARHPETAVYGLWKDVLPRLAAKRSLDCDSVEPEAGYLILATPRSGSYFLCDLLAGLGLGTPDEHLDSATCTLARDHRLSLRDYLESLRRVASRNGWFGTKLISHVLFEAFESGFPPNDFVDWIQDHRLRIVYLQRRDKVRQAVSNYFARHTGVWTAKTGDSTPPRPDYDFGELNADYQDLLQQEEWLRLVRGLVPEPLWTEIVYEDLDRRTPTSVADLVAFLTGTRPDPAELELHSGTARQRDGRSEECAVRFAAELRRAHPVSDSGRSTPGASSRAKPHPG